MARRGALTVYVARKVITMDEAVPLALAVAVDEDGRIAAVGSLEEVKARSGSLRIDRTFEDKVLVPGFIDPHLHPFLGGILLPMEFAPPDEWVLPGRVIPAVRGRDAYLARLKALEETKAPGEWLFVWGYQGDFHGPVGRHELDQISRLRPIVQWHRAFHEIHLNTPALEALGLTRERVSGQAQTDWVEGRFFENGLKVAVPGLAPMLLEPTRWMKALETLKEVVHRGGLTTIADLSAYVLGESELDRLKEAFDNDATPFRTFLVADGKEPFERCRQEPERAAEFVRGLAGKNGEKVRFLEAVKLFSDGAFFSQMMQMRDGYTDGHQGAWLSPPAELLEAARIYWRAGLQIHVHSNGDAGVQSTLDALETLLREMPREDHRFTVEHFGFSTPEQCEQIARLGAAVSANPYFVHVLGEKFGEVGLGAERAQVMVRAGTLLRNKVHLALHSDFTMAPAKPLLLAWCAVNRLGLSGRILGAEERISVEDALRAITIEAAWVLRMEREIGSITVGKRADFTVLEEDPYAVDAVRLKDIPLWGTVFEGRLFPLEEAAAGSAVGRREEVRPLVT